MKTTGFLKKDFFGLGILTQLFNRPQSKNKSESLEDLKQEITSSDYWRKIKFLIRQDLLLRYSDATVQKGLEGFNLKIIAEDIPHLEMIKPVFIQEPSTPVERRKEILKEEKQQEAWKVVKEEELGFQKQPTPVRRLNEILTEEKQQEVWKVERRIPKWFKKPYQYNTQILLAFMQLLGDGKSVSYFDLQSVPWDKNL